MGMEIERAYCADLMSDVLAFSINNSLLITGLTNTQVIRTAEVANIKAIVFIQNKRPDMQTISLADEKNIPRLGTDLSMFDTCGLLFEKAPELLRTGVLEMSSIRRVFFLTGKDFKNAGLHRAA
jgi:hypothetical protein